MPSTALVETFLAVTAAILGTCIGSFLNVVIYRLPREDCQVHKPNRSFCPNCKKQIPWYLNIPVFSWIVLFGKCQNCKQPISWRYPGVELLTGAFFLAIWLQFGGVKTWDVAIIYWVMISLFISATFIDFDHMIIPDSLTLGGAVFGILATLAVPTLMGAEFAGNRFHAVGWSIFGAFVRYGIFWAVISLGKLMFGRREINFEGSEKWTLSQPNDADNPLLEIGAKESISWDDIFFRDSDRLRFTNGTISLDGGDPIAFEELVFRFDNFRIGGKEYSIEDVEYLSGEATSVAMSREAMGFGDAKFEACVGAILGWKAVPFSLFAGSILGCLGWLIGKIFGKDQAKQLPFGPYLALGAILWLFCGPQLLRWYFGLLRGA